MTPRTLPLPPRSAVWMPLLAAMVLGGCAGLPARDTDAALAPLQHPLQAHTGQALAPWPDNTAPSDVLAQRSATLRQQPLTLAAAVELALIHHRGLQVTLAELQVGQAELAQATRWPNPGFSFMRTWSGDAVELERGLHFNLGRLLLMPLSRELEQQRQTQAQTDATLRVLGQVAEVKRRWIDAVAAREALGYQQQVLAAAQAGAELARRMVAAGNFNTLRLAQEQAFEAEAALNLARAERERDGSRERLNRALGLWGDGLAYTLPERLPDLPAQPLELPGLEATAIGQRLDVQAAKLASERLARSLGLTRSTRFVNVLELGVQRSTANDGDRSRAWEIGLELPIFDSGDARIARAEALHTASLHRTADVAINARSEVREAYGAYRHAWDIAQHTQAVLVPIRQRIGDQNLLRYNGMLIGVFELLAEARAQIASVATAIDARRDFWRAEAELQQAQIGPAQLSSTASSASRAAPAAGGGH